MSSLWTPGGEVPMDRSDRGSEEPPAAHENTMAGGTGAATGTDDPRVAQAAAIQQLLLESPAADIVAQHAVGLIELAALHLGREAPRLGDARLAIDAARALLDAVGDRLGPAAAELRAGLTQLQMAYVQVADGTAHDTGPNSAG